MVYNRNMEKNYWAITGDVVKSRMMEDRKALQKQLFRLCRLANREFKRFLVVPLDVILGDEIQGLAKEDAPLVKVFNLWEEHLYPVRIRLGVGNGPIGTGIYRSTAQMDGVCFRNSRRGLEKAKKENGFIRFGLTNPKFEDVLNLVMLLEEGFKEEWQELHFRRYYLYRTWGTMEKVAKKEGVTKQSVAESLKAVNYKLVVKAEEILTGILSGQIP